jgi:hypothetical protein
MHDAQQSCAAAAAAAAAAKVKSRTNHGSRDLKRHIKVCSWPGYAASQPLLSDRKHPLSRTVVTNQPMIKLCMQAHQLNSHYVQPLRTSILRARRQQLKLDMLLTGIRSSVSLT